MAKYEEILGIGPWNFLEFKLSPDEEQKTVIASGKIKDVELEIIEPHSDKVIHTKFLEDNGPGYIIFYSAVMIWTKPVHTY